MALADGSPWRKQAPSQTDLWRKLRLRWQAYQHLVVFHFHRIGRDADNRGEGKHVAVPHVEARAVARALDLVTVQVAFSHRAVVVRTNVRDGEVFTRNVEDRQRAPVNFHELARPVRQFVFGRHGDELGRGGINLVVIDHSNPQSSSRYFLPSSPYAPALRTLSASSAHFRRVGPSWMPSISRMSSLLICFTSSNVLPMIDSVSIEAEACEMAHPFPLNATSFTRWFSSSRTSIRMTSPHSGLSSSYEKSCGSSVPW